MDEHCRDEKGKKKQEKARSHNRSAIRCLLCVCDGIEDEDCGRRRWWDRWKTKSRKRRSPSYVKWDRETVTRSRDRWQRWECATATKKIQREKTAIESTLQQCEGVEASSRPKPHFVHSERWMKRWRVLGIGIMNVYEWLATCTKPQEKEHIHSASPFQRSVCCCFLLHLLLVLLLAFLVGNGFASVSDSPVISRRMNRMYKRRMNESRERFEFRVRRNETDDGTEQKP